VDPVIEFIQPGSIPFKDSTILVPKLADPHFWWKSNSTPSKTGSGLPDPDRLIFCTILRCLLHEIQLLSNQISSCQHDFYYIAKVCPWLIFRANASSISCTTCEKTGAPSATPSWRYAETPRRWSRAGRAVGAAPTAWRCRTSSRCSSTSPTGLRSCRPWSMPRWQCLKPFFLRHWWICQVILSICPWLVSAAYYKIFRQGQRPSLKESTPK